MNHSSRIFSLLIVILRLPIILLVLPFVILAYVFKVLGEFGQWIDDTVHDISHSLNIALGPKAWRQIRDLVEEKNALEQQVNFKAFKIRKLEDELANRDAKQTEHE